MRTKKFVSVLLAISLSLSIVFVATPVHAAAIISHPGGTTIDVDQGGDPFLLRHRLEWDESDVGYYIITIYWDCPDNNPQENFTFENASAYFDNDDTIENTVVFAEGFSPENENVWRYVLQVKNTAGDSRDGQFTVDIWLRAAGEGGTPHYPTENHPIYYSGIDVAESSIVSETPSPVTVRVQHLTDVAYPTDVADVYVQGDTQGEFWQPQMKFDISDVPSEATINSVKLWLYRTEGWEWETENMYVYRVDNQTWDEMITTSEFDSQTLENQETRTIGWTSNGWDYVNVENQFLSDYNAGNTYTTIRLEHVDDDSSTSDYIYNTGELNLGSDPLQFYRIFYSKDYNGRDPYLEVEYTLSIGSSSSSETGKGDSGDISFSASFEDPQLKVVNDYDLINIPGCGSFATSSGAPIIPKKSISVLLPPGEGIYSIRVTPVASVPVKKEVYLYPGQRPVRVSDNSEPTFTPPDPKIYESSYPYPSELHRLNFVTSYRGYRIAVLTLFPIIYVPAMRQATFHPRLEIEIKLRTAAEGLAFRPTADADKWVRKNVINPEFMSLYKEKPVAFSASPSGPENSGIDYLIITRNMFLGSLDNFVKWKENKGLGVAVEVVENENLINEYPGRDIPEKIRNCIKDYYENENIKWVLLGGDVDNDDFGGNRNMPEYELDKPWEIPVRYVWNPGGDNYYTGHNNNWKTTDLYFAGLDNDWDYDEDNRFGENKTDCGLGVDEADFFADVYVGRFSARDEDTMAAIVAKTVAFEQNTPGGFGDVCLFGDHIGGLYYTPDSYIDGKTLKRYIRDNYIAPVDTHEYYDKDFTLSENAFIDAINSYNPMLVNVAAHGNPEDIGKRVKFITLDILDNITGNGFALFAMSCLTNAFDSWIDPCLGEAMLRKGDGGAVGYIGGAWELNFYPEEHFLVGVGPGHDALFFKWIFDEGEYRQGAALYKSKAEYAANPPGPYDIDERGERKHLFVIMLLGDPEINLIDPSVPFRRVSMSVSPGYKSAARGTTIDYTVTVYNIGNTNDSYDLSVGDNAGWNPSVSPSSLTIPAGGNGVATLSVTIPENAVPSEEDSITVTAISQENAQVNASVACASYAGLRKVIYPSDDVYVEEGSGNMNKRPIGQYLKIGIEGDDLQRSWLKFDLSDIPPWAYISCAKLYLYFDGHNVAAPGGIGAHFSDNDNWSEVVLTWDNQPSFNELATDNIDEFSVDVFSPDSYIWKSWDLTSDVRAEFEGDKEVTWCLKAAQEPSSGSNRNRARSKDYWDEDNGYVPYLEILYFGVSESILPGFQIGLLGETLGYTVTVTNMEESSSGNYELTVSDNENWNPKLSENLLENVGLGESRTVTLSVTILENALLYTQDNIIVTVTSTENAEISYNETCIAQVVEVKFGLVTLYEISSDVKLYLENGSKLVLKFYTYENTYENENLFWSGTTPAHVEKNENVPHPENIGVKKVRLDLTTDNTENVIKTIDTFIVRRSNLMARLSAIKSRWPFATPPERSALIMEISGIKAQWPFAPS